MRLMEFDPLSKGPFLAFLRQIYLRHIDETGRLNIL